jgi:8-oxo-dGTP pyrophosphatase MutT (NUDIX family)
LRSPRPWTLERKVRLFEHPLLNLERHDLVAKSASADPAESRRQALVLDTPDWVNVVALDRQPDSGSASVVMVRQWRFGIAAATLEIPGGMVDSGEAARDAAERELYEETGYRARSWRQIGQVEPNPALFNNLCLTFLAEDLEQLGAPAGDGDEEIEVVRVPLPEIPARISSGEIGHALVIAAFHFHHLTS